MKKLLTRSRIVSFLALALVAIAGTSASALVAGKSGVAIFADSTSSTSSTTTTGTTTAAEPNDNIPGVPYTLPGPVTGTLNSASNPNDVYSVSLTANTKYKITLDAPAKSAKGTQSVTFAVRIYGSSATDVTSSGGNNAAELEASGKEVNYIEYTPTVSGTYYIDARASSGNGAYTLYFGTLGSTESCPGKKVKLNKYYSASLAPQQNKTTLCYSVPIDSKKSQSLHMRTLSFTGAIAGETNEISATILDPNGNELTTCEGGCDFDTIGTATFKPSRIGLYFFEFRDSSILPSTFSFAVTKKLGTDLSLATAASEKKKGNRYRATATAYLTPKQKNVKVNFYFKKCNDAGTKCKQNTTKVVRTNKKGKAKAVVFLVTGRYEVSAKFAGSGKRLSSASLPDCLAVGPEGTCISS